MIRPGDVCVVYGNNIYNGEIVEPVLRAMEPGGRWACRVSLDDNTLILLLFSEIGLEPIGSVAPVIAEELLIDALKRYGYDGLYDDGGDRHSGCFCTAEDKFGLSPNACVSLQFCRGGYKRGKKIVPGRDAK